MTLPSDPAGGAASAPGRPGTLVVIAGPSGVGKGTVHRLVRDQLPDARLSVSVTTRPARPGEVDGVDYRFVDRLAFQSLVAEGALLEWAEYAGNLYGTPAARASALVDAGAVVLLDIEVQGALQVRERVPDALLVFLRPPSFDELRTRLERRGTEDDAEVERRLNVARAEIALADDFDLQVVNDDPARCAAEVVRAIAAHRERLAAAGSADPDDA